MKPYSECSAPEILARMSPVQKNVLATIEDREFDWSRLNAQTRACLVDRTLTTTDGDLTEQGHRVRNLILTDRAAAAEHRG